MVEKTKKIHKREKAKRIAKIKHDAAQLLSTAATKYIPSNFDDPKLDIKARRRMIQLVKNRVAAQKTRDTRKTRFADLMEKNNRLDDENKKLLDVNTLLMDRIRELEESQRRLLTENQQLKQPHQPEIIDRIQPSLVNPFKQTTESEEEIQGQFSTGYLPELPSPLLIRRTSSNISRTSRDSNICFTKFFTLTIIIASFYSLRITKIHPTTRSSFR